MLVRVIIENNPLLKALLFLHFPLLTIAREIHPISDTRFVHSYPGLYLPHQPMQVRVVLSTKINLIPFSLTENEIRVSKLGNAFRLAKTSMETTAQCLVKCRSTQTIWHLTAMKAIRQSMLFLSESYW